MRLDEIVARLGGELRGDGALVVSRVAPLDAAGEGDISFLSNPRYRKQLATTGASAVIVPPGAADDTALPRIVHPNPYACYARVVALLNPAPERPRGVLAGAVVRSRLPESASIGENAVVGEGVTIGERVTLFPGVVVGDGVTLGDDTTIGANAVIYRDCVIGSRVVIHSGAVIGADGFGFAKEGDRWLKIPQVGRVVIGNDVEIGANTCIDRGALGDTVIADGVKLDNQIQIAHNCQIGENTAMAGCVGIAGSTRIGARCTVGGAGMIIGHLELADDVHVSAGTMVTKNLTQAGQYTSIFPLEAHDEWLHNAAWIKRLARLAERVAELEKTIEELRKSN